MSDIAVGIAIGATVGSSVGAATGSTIRHVERLGKTVEALEGRLKGVQEVRALEDTLASTGEAAVEARERLDALGDAMREGDQPAAGLGDALEAARAEVRRLDEAMEQQSETLDARRADLRATGDAVENLAERESELTSELAMQSKQLGELKGAAEKIQAARARRAEARANLIDAGALGASFLRPLKLAVGGAIDFESAMADVRKVVDFDTPEQFGEMGRAIEEMSTRIPIAATGLAEIVAAGGQAGVAREELLAFARDAAMVGVAFDMSAGEAGSAMTGLRNIFGLGHAAALDLAGAYNHLANNMDATAPAILQVVSGAGSMGKLLGLTGQQVGAFGATMIALKSPPNVAATAIKGMLSILSNAEDRPEKFQAALDGLGLSAEGLKEDLGQDAQGAILRLFDAIGASEDKVAVLTNLFGQEYGPELAKVVGNLDQYRDALALASSGEADASSVQAEYAARADTTQNSLQLMGAQFQRLGNTVGRLFLPPLRTATEVIGKVVDAATAIVEQFPATSAAIVTVVGGLVALKIGASVARYGMTFIDEAVAASTATWRRGRHAVNRYGAALHSFARAPTVAAVRGLGAIRLAMLSTGIGTLVVALGVGAALVVKYWEPIKAFFGGLWDGIKAGVGPAIKALGPLGEMLGFIGGAVASAFEWFGRLFAPVEASNQAVEAWGSTGERIGHVVGQVFGALLAPVEAVVKGIGWTLDALGLIGSDDASKEKEGSSWWSKLNPFGGEEDAAPAAPPPVVRTAAVAGLGLALAGAPAAAGPPSLDASGAAAEAAAETAARNDKIRALADRAFAPTPSVAPAVAAAPVVVGPASVADEFAALTAGAGEAAPVEPVVDVEDYLRTLDEGGGQLPASDQGSSAFEGGVGALPSPRAVTVNVTVGDIVIHAPAGADTTEIGREIERQLADVMRRAADEARLAETDGL